MSPPSPPHADPELELVPPRLSKEELIQNMDRVDREITMVEQQISKLKKKQVRMGGVVAPRERILGVVVNVCRACPRVLSFSCPYVHCARVLFCAQR